jgi:hypothetical protein
LSYGHFMHNSTPITKKACEAITSQAFLHSPKGKRISASSLELVQEQRLVRQQEQQLVLLAQQL